MHLLMLCSGVFLITITEENSDCPVSFIVVFSTLSLIKYLEGKIKNFEDKNQRIPKL